MKLAKFTPHENVPFVVAILNKQNDHILNMGLCTCMHAQNNSIYVYVHPARTHSTDMHLAHKQHAYRHTQSQAAKFQP